MLREKEAALFDLKWSSPPPPELLRRIKINASVPCSHYIPLRDSCGKVKFLVQFLRILKELSELKIT